MIIQVWLSLAWILAACLLGFIISALFAGWLRLSRRLFLIPYLLISGALLYAYVTWSGVDLRNLFVENWAWGVLAGVIAASFLVINVRSQPASESSDGADLLLDIAWLGVVYGLIDGLFLNVMPVLVIWHGFSQSQLMTAWSGRIVVGFIALTASLLVTAAYHLGYPEFRNRKLGLVLVGNTIITLAYLISGNPLGSLISHIAMHIAAVFQGPRTTIQLPPHYHPTTIPHREI